jgi:hypothetical protein
MPEIFHAKSANLDWSSYASEGSAAIRFKAVTFGAAGLPGVQYLEYGPGPWHHHRAPSWPRRRQAAPVQPR